MGMVISRLQFQEQAPITSDVAKKKKCSKYDNEICPKWD